MELITAAKCLNPALVADNLNALVRLSILSKIVYSNGTV
jgi:hypothetical protein